MTTRHATTVLAYRDDTSRGHYAKCVCGWESPTRPTRRRAQTDGRHHLVDVAPPPPEQPCLPGMDLASWGAD